MGIKITSLTITNPEVAAVCAYLPFLSAAPFVTGEFESTEDIEVGTRFAVNANRFDSLDPGGCPEGVARVTSISQSGIPLSWRKDAVDYQRPGESWAACSKRRARAIYLLDSVEDQPWAGEFEMEGEVTVVADR